MRYEAIENFSGVISMNKGQVREIPNESLANDLVKAGYIKKCVGNDNNTLKKELEDANSTIIKLQDENASLIEENKTLKELLEEKSQEPSITPEGNLVEENGDATPEENPKGENGNTTPEDNNNKNTSKRK